MSTPLPEIVACCECGNVATRRKISGEPYCPQCWEAKVVVREECTNHFEDGSKIFPQRDCCNRTAPEVPEGGTGGGNDTPETDAAQIAYVQWSLRNSDRKTTEEKIEGLLDDPRPANGWQVARALERRLRVVTAERDGLRRILNGCSKHGNYNGHACIGCMEAELATLRIAFGIQDHETIPEQEAKFGSILVDTAGSRRRVSPATENEERMAAELTTLRASLAAARAVLRGCLPAMDLLDQWARWIDEVSQEMDAEPGARSRFKQEVAMVHAAAEELRTALKEAPQAAAITAAMK